MVRYRVVFLDGQNRDYKEVEHRLNELAAQGWELVAVVGDRAYMELRESSATSHSR